MTDLLGPANAANTRAARPAETRVFGTDDTFFGDCSTPTAGDGTKLQAGWLNGLMQQVRRAIRGMSIPVDNTDDDMLLKAIRAAAQTEASLRAGFANNFATYSVHGTYSWVVPAGVLRILAEVWGGGGSGGGAPANSNGGSGGAGGGYARKALSVTPGETLTVIVGQGGAAVTGSLSGNNGGTSKVQRASTDLCTATGGHGGHPGSASLPGPVEGTAGIGTVGDILLEAARGAQGGGPSNTTGALGGMGGGSPLGGAGAPGTTGDANTGTSPGGGGSGGGGFTALPSVSGSGADGAVRLSWTDPVVTY